MFLLALLLGPVLFLRILVQGKGQVAVGRLLSTPATCCCASGTDLYVRQILFAISPCQYTDTRPTCPSSGPVTHGRAATRVPVLKILVRLQLGKVGFEPRLSLSRQALVHSVQRPGTGENAPTEIHTGLLLSILCRAQSTLFDSWKARNRFFRVFYQGPFGLRTLPFLVVSTARVLLPTT